MSKPIPKKVRVLMQQHRLAPQFLPQREIMKKLRLGRDYHRFYRLFYRSTIYTQLEETKND